MRVMLDTMIYDFLVARADALQRVKDLVAAGKLTIITTHIQPDQLRAIPDEAKREAVLSVPTVKVPTRGAMWGVSKWGEATWGDEATSANLARIAKKNPKHAADALIANTAMSHADVLVTNDKPLAKKTRTLAGDKLKIWDFADLVRFLETV